ncbi:hypothetical protein V2G26_009943 [Clonostachys chloroleuca]
MEGINIDASLIRQTHRLRKSNEKVVALQNGCICCNLRGDLWKLQQFDYVLIECSGITEPEQVAETFNARLTEYLEGTGGGIDQITLETLKEIKELGGLEKIARIDTTVTVLDAFSMLGEFQTDELVSDRQHVEKKDERTVSDLMADQIEFDDVILLNKTDMVDDHTKGRIIDPRQILNTGLFNLEVAQTGSGWLQDLHAMTVQEINGGNAVSLKPKSQDYTVQSFIYSQYRPFHPERLYALVYDMLILQLEHPSDEECDDEKIAEDTDSLLEENSEMVDAMPCTPSSPIPSNETIMVNKRNRPFLSPLFRSKGELFLATRPHRAGEWSQAGSMLSLTGGRPWFCTLSPEEYITGDKSVDRLVQHDIKKGGEWGDRHQELVFIGENINHEGLRGLLDDCLLTDEEYETCQEIMRDTARDDESKYETLGNALEDFQIGQHELKI